MATRDLQHFINNPQDVETMTPEEQALLAESLVSLDGEPKAEEPEPPKEEAKAEEEPPKEEPPKEEPPKAEPEGETTRVLAPDGKSTIPYAVLAEERRARGAAEDAARELAATVESLNSRLKALEEGKGDPGKGDALSADEIEQAIERIADEAPALAESLRTIVKAPIEGMRKLEERVNELQQVQQRSEEEVQREVRQEVQKAIDNNPALVQWKSKAEAEDATAEDKAVWESAKRLDSTLRDDPRYAEVPFAERFSKVVDLVAALHGPGVLPATAKPVEPPKPDPKKVKEVAEAKLSQAAKAAPPVTLSDLPAGAAVEQNERDVIENISVNQLGSKFMEMTPEKLQQYLRNI